MSSLTKVLSLAVEKLLFHPATIVSAERGGERFRLLRIQAAAFQGVAWTRGQAVQVFLGDMTKRAYTPMDFDPETGSASFLIYLHGGGPGSAWASSAQAGDQCHVMRPKDSLDFERATGPALFFGDETSIAAAQTLAGIPVANAHYVFEVSRVREAEVVLQELGIDHVNLMERAADGSHLADVVAKLTDLAAAMSATQWVFTGQARSIQSVRRSLREAGVPTGKSMVKAYWSPGKTGMD